MIIKSIICLKGIASLELLLCEIPAVVLLDEEIVDVNNN